MWHLICHATAPRAHRHPGAISTASRSETVNTGTKLSKRSLATLVVILLVTTITGKFYDTMYLITTSPPIVLFLLLGSSIPIMSGFFLQYLIVKACIGLSMEINRGLAALQMVLRWVLCIPDVTRTDRTGGARDH